MQEKDRVIIFLVITFTVILFVLGVFIFMLIQRYYRRLRARQQEALSNLILGQDNERARLARDLHDSLTPELSNIKFQVDRVELKGDTANRDKANIINALNESVSHVRQISHDLVSVSLQRYGLAEAIQDYCEEQTKENLRIHFDSTCFELELADHVKSNLFRVNQEFIQNTIKHSGANEVKISLKCEGRRLVYTFSDNGKGFDTDQMGAKSGIGIKNIRTRVNLLGGDLLISGKNQFIARITLII